MGLFDEGIWADESIWVAVGRVEEVPLLGTRVVAAAKGQIALFRTADGEIFALHNRCPHRQGPLSEGILHDGKVTCPLHNWVIDLASGEALAPDQGCTPTVPVKVEDGVIHLDLGEKIKVAHG